MLRKAQSSPALGSMNKPVSQKTEARVSLGGSQSTSSLDRLSRASVVTCANRSSDSNAPQDPREPPSTKLLEKLLLLSSLPDSMIAKHASSKLSDPTSALSMTATTVEARVHPGVVVAVTQSSNERCDIANVAVKIGKSSPISSSVEISILSSSPGSVSPFQAFEVAGGISVGPSADACLTLKAGVSVAKNATKPFVSAELSAPVQNAGVRLDFNQKLEPIETTLSSTHKTNVSHHNGSQQVQTQALALDPVLVFNEAMRLLAEADDTNADL